MWRSTTRNVSRATDPSAPESDRPLTQTWEVAWVAVCWSEVKIPELFTCRAGDFGGFVRKRRARNRHRARFRAKSPHMHMITHQQDSTHARTTHTGVHTHRNLRREVTKSTNTTHRF